MIRPIEILRPLYLKDRKLLTEEELKYISDWIQKKHEEAGF